MQTITFHNPDSPILFCKMQIQPEKLSQLSTSSPYLNGLNYLGIIDNLNACMYPPLLLAIWGEKNNSRRLAWLKEHAGLHALLMCERAIAEFVANPCVATITTVALPLIEAASCRMVQDCTCSTDPTVCDDAHTKLKEIYLQVLVKKIDELTPHLSLATIRSNQDKIISQKSREKVIEVLTQSIENPDSLPSPEWISQHGLRANKELMQLLALLNNDRSNTPPQLEMFPKNEWAARRTAIATQMVQHLRNLSRN